MPSQFKFKDRDGREWEIDLRNRDIPAIREIGFELVDLIRPDRPGEVSFDDRLDDVEKWSALFWYLCGRHREAEITREQFDDLFYADVREDAKAALIEATFSFFRGRKAGQAAKRMLTIATDKAARKAEADLRATPESTTGPTSSSSPNGSAESSELTTGISPSAS